MPSILSVKPLGAAIWRPPTAARTLSISVVPAASTASHHRLKPIQVASMESLVIAFAWPLKRRQSAMKARFSLRSTACR